MSYLTGFGGTALLASTELPIAEWSLNLVGKIIPFVNSKSGNHPVKAMTTSDFAGSLQYDFDPALQPFQAPLSLVPGTILASCKFCLDGPSGTNFILASSIIIQGLPFRVPRDGKNVLMINFQNNGGTITLPGGSSF